MPASRLDRRAFLLLGAASLALSACGGIIGPPDASQIYILKPVGPNPAPGPQVTYRVAVELPDAPDYLDTDRIAIERGELGDYYANAVWQERLPSGVRRALIEALEATHRAPVISSSAEGLRSDYFLKTDIRDFTARYDAPNSAPVAVVRIEAKMVQGFGAKTVNSTVVKREVAAGDDSVAAAVQAFNQACGAALDEIANWALNTPPPPKD